MTNSWKLGRKSHAASPDFPELVMASAVKGSDCQIDGLSEVDLIRCGGWLNIIGTGTFVELSDLKGWLSSMLEQVNKKNQLCSSHKKKEYNNTGNNN